MARAAPVVWIDRAAFLTIVASFVEAYHREASGFLVGRHAQRTIRGRRRTVTLIETAYPLLTSERKPSSVAPLNEAAYDRAVRVVHGLDIGLDVLGGFHSHPNGPSHLSNGDLAFVLDHVRHVERRGWTLLDDQWLELVAAVKRRRNVKETSRDWYWQEAGHKARARVWVPGRERYDLELAAYALDPNELEALEADGGLGAARALQLARPVKVLTGL